MDLLLKNLRWQNGTEKLSGDVRIKKGIIQETGKDLLPAKRELVIRFDNHFLYPGLINSHDHLEMNLYPKLGKPLYANYIDWAHDIYKPEQSPIREIEKVDIRDRLLWGGVKNLISGATTVVHHNPWHRFLGRDAFPVKVLKHYAWAHSVGLGKNIARSFPAKKNIPFVIHAAEGKDERAFSEISKLDALGLLESNTVIVHGIALSDRDILRLTEKQSSVVWCPVSNLFMFGQTADVRELRNTIGVALGSDSTLTGSPTFLLEMKAAAGINLVNNKELYEMVTGVPARMFRLPYPEIRSLASADLFVSTVRHEDYYENLLQIASSEIDLVLVKGEVRLIAPDADDHYTTAKYPVTIQGSQKFTDTNISALKQRIEKKVGPSILEKNPLWNFIEV